MLWESVFFERNLDQKNIIKALAHVFRVEEKSVALQFGSLAPNSENHISVFCLLNVIRGDFPIYLNIGPWYPVLPPEDAKAFIIIGQLCDVLGSSALVQSDFGYDDDTWVLIRGERNYQFVFVDADKAHHPLDLFELEITHEAYKFSEPISLLESRLGNLITRPDLNDESFYEYVSWWMKRTPKADLLQVLNNLRGEAKRMYREDLLQDAIERVDSHLPSNS